MHIFDFDWRWWSDVVVFVVAFHLLIFISCALCVCVCVQCPVSTVQLPHQSPYATSIKNQKKNIYFQRRYCHLFLIFFNLSIRKCTTIVQPDAKRVHKIFNLNICRYLLKYPTMYIYTNVCANKFFLSFLFFLFSFFSLLCTSTRYYSCTRQFNFQMTINY